MDLRLFHPTDDPKINYKRLDYHNSRTGLFACHLLEHIGWYTFSVKQRLLGHYRLYQVYKRRRSNSPSAIPSIQGYILQYKASYRIKHFWYLLISRLPSLFAPDPDMEMHMVNKILINDRALILYEFLANADIDFEKAFNKAVQQINEPDFINTAGIIKHQAVIKEPTSAKELTGKGKGVFSKKQVLILFDLLAQTDTLEPFRLDNPDKHQAIAKFLVALTGKGLDTWLETLKDYHANHLYAFHTPAERANLMSILTNIADTAHAAGLRTITEQAEKNIRLLREQE